MWHLKTKLGTFWVVEANNDSNSRYLLGVNDQELGGYDDAEGAAKDVYAQETGYFKWDSLARIKAPDSINSWDASDPEEWRH